METVIWVLIPLAGIGLGALAIYTEHKRKMAKIEKGIDPEAPKETTPQEMLSSALVTVGVGIAFTLFYFLSGVTVWFLLVGLIVFFVGLGRTIPFFLQIQKGRK